MGLDCYVYARKKDAASRDSADQIWYGRKENEIHGFFQRYFGLDGDNCVELDLTEDMLAELQKEAHLGLLKHTTGFFFGGASDKEHVASVVDELVAAARKALADGDDVFYYAWY